MFADGQFCHPDGKARLIVDEVTPMPEVADDDYPWLLLTGRGTVSQWHTQTRTSKSPVLRQLYPGSVYVEIHPQDAAAIGVGNGEVVRVRSRRGELEATAWVTSTVRPGQLFIPMHYEATNRLTRRDFDPHSRQPNYKTCAVIVESVR